MERGRRTRKELAEEVALCRQQFYDILQLNLKPGEYVEIFTDWDEGQENFGVGPPEKQISLTVDEVLTSEHLNLWYEKYLIEIHL
jgi:hypothetical protein